MDTILAILVVLLLMCLILFFLLRGFIKRINQEGRLFYAIKSQHEEVNTPAPSDTIKEEKKVKEEKKNLKFSTTNSAKVNKVIFVDEVKRYQIDNLLSLVRKIDEKFMFDTDQLVLDFVKKKTDTEDLGTYYELKKIKDYIDKIGLYHIMTSQDPHLIEEIELNVQLINESIYHRYMVYNSVFNVETLMSFLEDEISRCDPTVYVFVGDKNKSFDQYSNVKTIYSDKVYKGIKILYKNKMYDYSLS